MDAADREPLLARLREVVGERYAFADPYEMRLYQYDASPETALPDIVVIPGPSEGVERIVKICADAHVPITPRSAASSLAGGTVPVEGGVVITFARMDRILEIDAEKLPPRGAAGRGHPAAEPGPQAVRLLLRARPIEPGRLHHRRQRRDQCGRPAHAHLWSDGQPCHRPRGRVAQRRAGAGRRAPWPSSPASG